MQTGSVLTLNFYSNPIDVMIGDDQTIYLNWKHFCGITDRDPEGSPPCIIRGEFDVDYIAFSYAVNNLADFVRGGDPLNAWLVLNEFPNYIIRELGVVRELIPFIRLDYSVYESGIFEHKGKMFVLTNKLRKFTGIHEPIIPPDVPSFPIVVSVTTLVPRNPLKGLAEKADVRMDILPIWMVEVSSLPYIVETSSAPKVMTNSWDHLGPLQRFDSPGVVGTHSCELDSDQKKRVAMSDEMTSKLMKVTRWPEDDGMTWAGSGLQCKPEL